MLFASFAIPLLEEITSLLLSFMEVFKGKATLKITKINKEIQDISNAETVKKNPIGFCLSDEPIEVIEEEEEDYDD